MWHINVSNVGDGGSGFCCGIEVYHQTGRAWKALVEIADNEGVAPIIAVWAKARINPLDPGVTIRPALSVRPEADRPTAWWNKPEPALIQIGEQAGVPLETVDASALDQIPAVHACRSPFFSLHYEKLGFTTRYRRTRCTYDEPERAVSGEFRRVRVGLKQPHGSLPNRSGDEVFPPQLPSRRMLMFRSCRLPATGIIYARTTYSPYRGRASFGRKLRGVLVPRLNCVSCSGFLRPQFPVP